MQSHSLAAVGCHDHCRSRCGLEFGAALALRVLVTVVVQLMMEDAFGDIADVLAPPQLSLGGQSSASSSAVDAFEDVAAAGAASGFRLSFPWAAAAAPAQRAFQSAICLVLLL